MKIDYVKKISPTETLMNFKVGQCSDIPVVRMSINTARVTARRLKEKGYEFRISESSGSPTYTIERIK